MKKTLNVGLIGFGMIGKVHAYCYSALPYYAPDLSVVGKIVAVATSREETARRAQETTNAEYATTDYREIVSNPEIDVVHICTPNAEHVDALLAAIEANKHIYCEKPLVADGAEASRVREALAAGRYVGRAQLAFHLRGFSAIRRAKELIDEGRLGRIVQYRFGYYHSSMLNPTSPLRWKHGEKGGSILDLASHLVDLVDYLVGLPAEAIAQTNIAHTSRPTRALGPGESYDAAPRGAVAAEDSATIMTRGTLETRIVPNVRADGIYESTTAEERAAATMPLTIADPNRPDAASGVIEATKLMNGAEDELRFEISGTRGALRFSLMDAHYLEFFDATTPSRVYGGDYGWRRIACGARYPKPESDFPSPKSTTGWLRAHVASLASFYRGIADDRDYGADLRQGLRVQDALEAIKESSRRRAWTRLETR